MLSPPRSARHRGDGKGVSAAFLLPAVQYPFSALASSLHLLQIGCAFSIIPFRFSYDRDLIVTGQAGKSRMSRTFSCLFLIANHETSIKVDIGLYYKIVKLNLLTVLFSKASVASVQP